MTAKSPRETRLETEFRRMLAILRPKGLIRFWCADLKDDEARGYLASQMSFQIVVQGLPGFVSPEEFSTRFPDRFPEKYLIVFACKGLIKAESGEIREIKQHAMEAIFGHDFPGKPPRFVWLTPIWHPNIMPPYLCTTGRPFAVSTTLDQICLMVGQMIQYRNYNVEDSLNREAREWALENQERLPVDTRSLLDAQADARPLITLVRNDGLGAWDPGAAGVALQKDANDLVELT